jgi:spore germination protein YaaH
MRSVFSDPQPFIDACIQQGTALGLTGFNIDWEPTTEATAQDAQDYANFLTNYTNALNQKGLKVQYMQRCVACASNH